ncbi:unnamed protein product, partial [Ixodes pacificus]
KKKRSSPAIGRSACHVLRSFRLFRFPAVSSRSLRPAVVTVCAPSSVGNAPTTPTLHIACSSLAPLSPEEDPTTVASATNKFVVTRVPLPVFPSLCLPLLFRAYIHVDLARCRCVYLFLF